MYAIGVLDERDVSITIAETPTFSKEADRILGEHQHRKRSPSRLSPFSTVVATSRGS